MSGPGQTYGVSGFIDPMINSLGWSRTRISGLYSAGSMTASFGMIFVGQLLDRYSARLVLAIVTMLFGLVLIGMSRINSGIDAYLGFAAIRTLGQGAIMLITTTMVAMWFVRLRGRVMAIAIIGPALSQASFPPLIQYLINDFGWRDAWIALGIIVWVSLLAPVLILVRRSPEAIGLLPDGDIKASLNNQSDLDSKSMIEEPKWTLGEAIRTRSFWLILFVGSTPSLISTAMTFHNESLLVNRGLNPELAAAVLATVAPASLAASFFIGYLSERLPNRYLLAVGQLFLAATMMFYFVMNKGWHAFIYGGLLGLSGGSNMVVNSVIWPNYYGRHRLGSIRGVVSSSMVAFAALGPLPFGLMFDITGGYNSAMLSFLILPLSGIIAAVVAKPPNKDKPPREVIT